MKYLALALIWASLTSAAPPHKLISRSISGRIIGGSPANAGEYPYAAAIYQTTNSGRFFCGGALLNAKWVITAARCTHQSTSFTVYLGSNTLNGDDPNRLTLTTMTFMVHPDFDPETIVNDIGVVGFHAPITFTDYVKPVLLPTIELPDNAIVAAIGWGSTDDTSSDLSNHLNSVLVSSVPQDECRSIYGSQIDDNIVCVTGNYNEGACRGDIGGPLVITLAHLAWHFGVSSFISANGCESLDPSGYTRTYPYVDWIKNVTVV